MEEAEAHGGEVVLCLLPMHCKAWWGFHPDGRAALTHHGRAEGRGNQCPRAVIEYSSDVPA